MAKGQTVNLLACFPVVRIHLPPLVTFVQIQNLIIIVVEQSWKLVGLNNPKVARFKYCPLQS